MSSKLIPLLGGLFPSLDSPLIEYLASIADEANPKKWKSSKEAVETLGELLESYEAVENEAQAKVKCAELFTLMQQAGIVPAPAPTPAPAAVAPKPVVAPAPAVAATVAAKPVVAATPAASAKAAPVASPAAAASPLPQPGYYCQARYSGDGLFYSAQVLSVKTVPVVKIRVKFLDYNDEEEVAPSSIKDVKEGVLPTKVEGKRAMRDEKEEDEFDDDEDEEDSDEEDEETSAATATKKKVPGMLLTNPVRIGELAPSLAAIRLSEREQAQIEAEKNLTPKELKMLRKRQAKAEKASKDAAAKRVWNPDEHRSAIQKDALPIYLQSQHLSKKAGTKDIALEDVTLLSPDNTELLTNTELRFVFGRKYGIIGRNGIGKSTLLRQISTYQLPRFPTWIKIMHVEQEVIAEGIPVLEVVMNADLERGLLLKEEKELNEQLKQLELETAATTTAPSNDSSSTDSAATPAPSSSAAAAISDRLSIVFDRLNELDSQTAMARASTILSGLQFTPEMQQMPTKALSGGWRMRVALACALFVSPDLLLLDEPTNHLDFPAVLWLQSYLQSYPKTVVIVSHDRVFLNAVITDVIHFTNRKRLEYFRGDYTNFLKVKEDRYKAEKRAYEGQQLQRQQLQEYITTFKTEKKCAAQARKVGQAMMKQKQLDKMERDGLLENPDAESTDNFSLRFPEPGQLRVPLIAEIKGLSFKYPKRSFNGGVSEAGPSEEELRIEEEKRRIQRQNGTLAATLTPEAIAKLDANQPFLLEDINVRVEISSRIGIIGANGCGKTTLIKVLLGELPAIDGLVWLNSNVRIAYFTQHHVDQLHLGISAVENLKLLFPGTLDVECRRHLGRFGLIGDLVLMQTGHLSGGQRSRLAFAIICWKEPHMLILDEPTNHLDMETCDVLITAINNFKGAVLVISHDQHFLQGCLKEFWSIQDRKLKVFESYEACKKATYAHVVTE